MDSLGFSDLNALAPGGCYRGQVEVTRDTGAPLLADAERGQQYCYVPQSGSTDCGARVETRTGRRVCVCLLAVLAPEGCLAQEAVDGFKMFLRYPFSAIGSLLVVFASHA